MKEFIRVVCIEIEAALKLYISKVGLGLVEWNLQDFLERMGVGGGWIGHPGCSLVWALCLQKNLLPKWRNYSRCWELQLAFANFISSQFIPSTETPVQRQQFGEEN